MSLAGRDRSRQDVLLIIFNAIRNASREPATRQMILAILEGQGGDPSHVRALFGDVSLHALDHAAAAHGIRFDTVLDAYAAARGTVAAANAELDAALAERETWRRG